MTEVRREGDRLEVEPVHLGQGGVVEGDPAHTPASLVLVRHPEEQQALVAVERAAVNTSFIYQ